MWLKSYTFKLLSKKVHKLLSIATTNNIKYDLIMNGTKKILALYKVKLK